jgi:hypothetical protein
MGTIFENVASQYVDNNGKTRMLNYALSGGTLSLVVSPIPPLDSPVINIKKDIKLATMAVAVDFMKARGLLAVEQDGNKDEGIQGIWVETKEQNSGIFYGYIPIAPSKKIIGNIPFSQRNDPIRTDPLPQSELMIFRQNRKIAEILKQYTLYTYALHPEDFDENYFWVDPNHVYDMDRLGGRLFVDQNDIIYNAGYIIVPSEDVKQGLMAFLKVSLLNDTPGVMATLNTKTIENYYQTISDFRNQDEQLIFVNKSGLKRWKQESTRGSTASSASTGLGASTGTRGPVISAFPIVGAKDPYYYKNPKIRRDNLMIVQNVIGGTLERALSVSYKWNTSRINPGYMSPISNIKDDISYIIYKEMGEASKEKRKTNFSHIFQYENGDHAALLFFI